MTTAAAIRRPEQTVLLQCARSRTLEPVRWATPPAAPFDWAYFLATAETHCVTELLLAPLQAARAHVPDNIVERLEQRVLGMTAVNLGRAKQLGDLLRLFEQHRIRALAFKGPAFAVSAYGHVGRRSSVDIDLLVHPGDASRARPLLLANGYTLPARVRRRGGSLLYGLLPSAGRDDTLYPARPELAQVDIHVAFAYWTLGIRLDTDALFARAIGVEVAGLRVTTLCPDDHLLALAIHGTMHAWSVLRFISDIDAVAPQVVHWDAVVGRARSARMLRALSVALLLARDLLGTELPAEVTAIGRRDREAAAVAESVAARLFDPPAEWDPKPWFLSLQDRPRDRLRFQARSLVYEWFLKWPWDEWLGRRRGPLGA